MPNSHMGQLDIFVKRLRATYPKGYVPDFDPNDGGINAEILLLFDSEIDFQFKYNAKVTKHFV